MNSNVLPIATDVQSLFVISDTYSNLLPQQAPSPTSLVACVSRGGSSALITVKFENTVPDAAAEHCAFEVEKGVGVGVGGVPVGR